MLPAETEERVKRRALNVCRDHLRKVLEVERKIPQMIDSFIKDDRDSARQLFTEISESEDEVDKARRLVSRELAEIGAILLSREDFLRFTNLTSEIADFCEGIAFYLLEIMEHGWNVPMDIKTDLLKLSEAVFESVLRLRETMMVLRFGSSKAMEKAKDVEAAERVVDELYRELSVKLLSRARDKLDFPPLILLRDVLRLLEGSADKAEDAADVARILSFIM